jgi:hypothetical protein
MNVNPIGTPDWKLLPQPVDDEAARRLRGAMWPAMELDATDGRKVDISKLDGWCVVFAYPRTGQPGVENPAGWDLITGARSLSEPFSESASNRLPYKARISRHPSR